MRWKTLTFAAVALLLIAALLPICQTAVWDGHFPLTIVFNEGETLNAAPGTFLFAACWQEFEAECAMRSGPESGVAFCPADDKDGNRFTVHVRCSGRSGLFECVKKRRFCEVGYRSVESPLNRL